jgi:uncharacterized protein YoxC
MDWLALFKIFQAYGPTAISSVLVVVVLSLIKQVHKNGEDDKERAKNYQALLDSSLKELRGDTFKVLEEHGRKISYIELEYVRRESFYRELGGWKDDINRLFSHVSDFNKSVTDLWKDRRG